MNTISFAVISPNYMSKQTSSPSYNHLSQLQSIRKLLFALLCVSEKVRMGEIPPSPLFPPIFVAQFEI